MLHRSRVDVFLALYRLAPSREKLTCGQNIHFRAINTAGTPMHRFPNLYQHYTCCVAANTEAVIPLQLPSAALVQWYSSVAKVRYVLLRRTHL